LFRLPDRDILALASESCPPGAEALLQPVIVKGQRTGPPPPLTEIRGRAARSLGGAEPRPMLLSDPLKALAERLREERK
jgi:hypothetical protein